MNSKTMINAGLSLSFMLGAACELDTADEIENEVVITAANLSSEYLNAQCGVFVRCADAIGAHFSSVDECLEALLGLGFSFNAEGFEDASRYTIDGDKGRECINSIKSVECTASGFSADLPEVCNEVVSGATAEGECCADNNACATGLFCSNDDLCEAASALGESCGGSMRCDDGLYCDDSSESVVCAEVPALGDDCSGAGLCAGETYCDSVSQECEALKVAGAACVVDSECITFECENSVCGGASKVVGESCEDDAECLSVGLFGVGCYPASKDAPSGPRECKGFGTVGDVCDADAELAPSCSPLLGAYCPRFDENGDAVESSVCKTLPTLGEDCEDSFFCGPISDVFCNSEGSGDEMSYTCTERGSVGDACSSSSECGVGLECDDASEKCVPSAASELVCAAP